MPVSVTETLTAPMPACEFFSAVCDAASACHQDNIAQAAVHAAQFFPRADDTKAATFVNGNAAYIFRENSCLQRPNSMFFRSCDQRRQQSGAEFLAARTLGHIDTYFGNTGIDASA